ncbi:MAG TPA: HD domain-containing phosphohydrolase [Gemmatimonadales bacterium]|nr:HD domain-containing phosphohydrolase [Gemmatimonadales bacterium]
MTKPLRNLSLQPTSAFERMGPGRPAGYMPLRGREDLLSARILVIDDEEANVVLMRRILERAGYATIADTSDPEEAADLCRAFQPDLILLDLHMSPLDGFGVLEQLAPVIPRASYLPILMLTGDSSTPSKKRALSLGAKDFVTKPFDVHEVLLRIHNLLVPRFMHLEMAGYNQLLERQVLERTLELEESRLEVLERLARAAEFRDDDTGQHTRRVGRIARSIAEGVGASRSEVDVIARAAPLHDVGKIGVPDQILLKPGKLTPEEFQVMQQHSSIGAEILAGGRSSLIQMAAEVARHHHERWDGSGYPAGLSGNAIPLAARVVALADVFDALAHTRPYRKAWPLDEVLAEIYRQAGAHFDPRLVDAFRRLPHAELI